MNERSRHPCLVNITGFDKSKVSVMVPGAGLVIVPYPEPRYRRVGDDHVQNEVELETGPAIAYYSKEKPEDVWLLDKRDSQILSLMRDDLIMRLYEAEKIISKFADGFGKYNTHLTICNYQHWECEWCNCGTADARTYAKKYVVKE